MPGILASGKRLEELCRWRLQLNDSGRCLDLSRARLSNFESYEAIGVELKDGSPPKVAENLKEFDSVEMVDLSHNFLQSVDPILRLVPNAWWINLAYNDIEYIPDEVHLPTVMGSLNVACNESLPLDSLEALQNKYIIRLNVDLGVPRVRGKLGLPVENRSSEVYRKRIAALSLQCPNIWVVNESYIPAIERGPREDKEEMTDTFISTEVVREGGRQSLLLGMSSDWCSRLPSPTEAAFLSALQSFSSKHPLDIDCFSLDLALDDYLEEARVANEKGVYYQASKGHRYPTVNVTKLLSLSREDRLDASILLSSYIISGIPETIFQEAMHAVLGGGPEPISFAEVKDIYFLPEFAHTALICLLRRTVMKDYDDFFSEEDSAALRHLRMVSVQPRYLADFSHLRAAYALLHGPVGGGSSGGGDTTHKESSLPKLSRQSRQKARAVAPPSPEEVLLLMALPDIVTSAHVSMKADDVTMQTIGGDTGHIKATWSEKLARRTVELLQKSAEYRRQMEPASSQTMAETTHMLDPLLRSAYKQQSMHQGSVHEEEEGGGALGGGDLRSLSMVEEEEPSPGFAHEQMGMAEVSHASSKRLIVSLVSENKEEMEDSVHAPNSLDLSVESGGGVVVSSPEALQEQELGKEMTDSRMDMPAIQDEEGSPPQGLRLLPDKSLSSSIPSERARSPSSRAYNRSRVSMPATDIAVFTADRVAEPQFGLMPRKETLRSARHTSEGVAMLHDSPVFVQPYQLPKLEVESVSLDRLGPVPEGWEAQDNRENGSLGSSTAAESASSVMSSATAARTMLAEMGTLRNVRNMMLSENRQAQSKVDSTTWHAGGTTGAGAGAGDGTGAGAAGVGSARGNPPDIRLSTTFSAYGNALDAETGPGAGAGAIGQSSWMTGLAYAPASRDTQKATSLSEFLENGWKAKEKQETEREEERRLTKERIQSTPKNLQTRVVTGVNEKLISLTSPIDNLKMATKYMNINMHTSHEEKDGGEVIYPEKTSEGRPLSSTWYPLKEKKQYVVANSPNQNPLQVVTQETAAWTVRQGSPSSRGGGFTVRPSSKSKTLRARSAGDLQPARQVNNKTISGHNEEYWPLARHERQSEFEAALKDTSDMVLAPSTVAESAHLNMKMKIQAGQYLRPSSRGPISAATSNLHLNSGYKVKLHEEDDSPVRILKAKGQSVRMFTDR